MKRAIGLAIASSIDIVPTFLHYLQPMTWRQTISISSTLTTHFFDRGVDIVTSRWVVWSCPIDHWQSTMLLITSTIDPTVFYMRRRSVYGARMVPSNAPAASLHVALARDGALCGIQHILIALDLLRSARSVGARARFAGLSFCVHVHVVRAPTCRLS